MSYLRIARTPAVFELPLSPVSYSTSNTSHLPHARFFLRKTDSGTSTATTQRSPPGEIWYRCPLLLYFATWRETLYTHDRDFLKFSFLDVRESTFPGFE